MNRNTRRKVSWSVCATALVALLMTATAPSAYAKLGFGGGCGGEFCFFASPGELRSDGRSLHLTGHVTCDPVVEGWKLHISVTQESTTASARVVITDDCVQGPIPFAADAVVVPGAPSFEPGKALACGMLLTGAGANIAHAGFWCRYIELRVQ